MTNQVDNEGTEDEIDFDYDNIINKEDLLEDLKYNPNGCAFRSLSHKKCLTNQQVYGLLKNQSNFLQISATIEEQLHKPNEHMCTFIDLSMS